MRDVGVLLDTMLGFVMGLYAEIFHSYGSCTQITTNISLESYLFRNGLFGSSFVNLDGKNTFV